MISRVRRIVVDLGGGGGRRFAKLLGGQLDVTLQAVETLLAAIDGTCSADEARRSLTELEHDGDRLREALVHELAQVIVTPIDREDLFRVSRSIDEVLDNLRDLQREVDLYRPSRPIILRSLLEAIAAAVVGLRHAVAALDGAPQEIAERAQAAKRLGNQIRRLYEFALAELFSATLTMETLKARELLRRLDVVGLRLDEAADALADAAIKRSTG